MKTITYNVYSFNELSEEAKKRAIAEHEAVMKTEEVPWLKEDMTETLKEILKENKIEGEPELQFSLDYCQGDGVMFTGTFYWNNHSIVIKHSGRYTHSNSKEIDIIDGNQEDATKEIYEQFETIYQNICKELEILGYDLIKSYTSEENVIETIIANDFMFTEEGITDNNQ